MAVSLFCFFECSPRFHEPNIAQTSAVPEARAYALLFMGVVAFQGEDL